MDIFLIVEVGYKFKFFGEDVWIVVKELSIVCIFGKFRYDECRCNLYVLCFDCYVDFLLRFI